MSVPAMIVDKLRNYEYEKCGCGDVVGDIYALIHQIADLEDELRAARALTPRDIAGGTASRGAADGTVAIDAFGCSWARVDPGCWFPLRHDPNSEVIELPKENGPYAIAYTPAYAPTCTPGEES